MESRLLPTPLTILEKENILSFFFFLKKKRNWS